jgi:DNA-binding NtrC family response regulator
MSESHERLDEAEPVRAPYADLPRTHVLIVDDDAAARCLCAGYCDLFDFTWALAKTAADGASTLQHERFDIVVMSLGMADHADLLGHCEGRARVVGLTPVGREDEAQRWLAAGLSAAIAKPISASRLFAALTTAAEPAGGQRSWAPA